MNSKAADVSPTRATKRTAKSQATIERILEAARELFNDEGTAAVSTNRIAAAAGLSPGNLYYHFADKQQIIRSLHGRFAAAHEQHWQADPGSLGSSASLEALRSNVLAGVELAWQYRFLQREILALLRADPLLLADHRELYERRLGQWRGFAEQLVAKGLISAPRSPRTLDDLTTATWLIAENWLAFLDVTGDPNDPEQVARGADLLEIVFDPYLTELGRQQWRASLPPTSTP